MSLLSWVNTVPKGTGLGAGQAPRPRFPNCRHLSVQVDEETALEQAVKFCQVHLGAAAQRQVSSALHTTHSAYASPACRTTKALGCRPEADVPWSWFPWLLWDRGGGGGRKCLGF